MGSRFCKNCGAEITDELQGKCPKCGTAFETTLVKKSPLLAAGLSLVFPGLGQSYNGNLLKGIGIFLGVVILWVISNFSMWDEALFVIIVLFWIIGIGDAYRDAGLMNQGTSPPKKHQVWLFCGVAALCVLVIGIILIIVLALFLLGGISAFTDTNDKSVELRVVYNGTVYADYGSTTCLGRHYIQAPHVFNFAAMGGCYMEHAGFRKNKTETGELRMDLVRNGQLVKYYTTSADSGEVWFHNFNEFLQNEAKDPRLAEKAPLLVNVQAEGEWRGGIDDKYGAQSISGTGPGTFTLTRPVFPVKSCIYSGGESAGTVPVVELSQGGTFLNRSLGKGEYNFTCAVYP